MSNNKSVAAIGTKIVLTALVVVLIIIIVIVLKDRSSDTVQNTAPKTQTVMTPTKTAQTPIDRFSTPLTKYFEPAPQTQNVSNVVGYFAYGAFLTYLPNWMADHWMSGSNNDGSITTFSPRDLATDQRDFSDIEINAKETTETFNADWQFETNKKDNPGTIINSEVFFNNDESLRIYHIENSIGDKIFDTYYVDGNGKTGIIVFSSSKNNYYYYSAKVKEFIKGLTLANTPQG